MGLREFEELLMASDGRWNRELGEDSAGPRADDRRGVRVFVGIDPDDEVDLVCKHCHAFIPLPEGRGRFPVREETAGL
jgi:hypothetical protein